MNKLVRTAVTYVTVLVLTTLLAPVAVLVSVWDTRWADPVLRIWARAILAAAGVQLEVRGLENVPSRTCVIVSNHQSHFDALAILTALRRHVRFVSKRELFRIPIFGLALRATGNIEVNRSGGDKDREQLRRAVDAVRERVTLLFFAEGTRSPDGALRPFKKGAMLLALEAGVPIVPLAVAGAREILGTGPRWIQGGRVVLSFGAPIPTEGRSPSERDRLTEEVHGRVAALLADAERVRERGAPPARHREA
jgi:1-acyl-sn-glycerol-3-phosphate acyltransferase